MQPGRQNVIRVRIFAPVTVPVGAVHVSLQGAKCGLPLSAHGIDPGHSTDRAFPTEASLRSTLRPVGFSGRAPVLGTVVPLVRGRIRRHHGSPLLPVRWSSTRPACRSREENEVRHGRVTRSKRPRHHGGADARRVVALQCAIVPEVGCRLGMILQAAASLGRPETAVGAFPLSYDGPLRICSPCAVARSDPTSRGTSPTDRIGGRPWSDSTRRRSVRPIELEYVSTVACVLMLGLDFEDFRGRVNDDFQRTGTTRRRYRILGTQIPVLLRVTLFPAANVPVVNPNYQQCTRAGLWKGREIDRVGRSWEPQEVNGQATAVGGFDLSDEVGRRIVELFVEIDVLESIGRVETRW